MMRMHIHVGVTDLAGSVAFYSAIFKTQPTVLKPDYAKWMLEEPRVNFAISTRAARQGLDHLGIQAENPAELEEITSRLKQADTPILDQGSTTCCYAQSTKQWVTDPAGIAWEAFHTVGDATTYGTPFSAAPQESLSDGACCAPAPDAAKPGLVQLKAGRGSAHAGK